MNNMNNTELQTPYRHCPLCEYGADNLPNRPDHDLATTGEPFYKKEHVAFAKAHSLYQPWMREEMVWVRCLRCGHVFSLLHYTEEGFKRLFEVTAIRSEQPISRTPRERYVAGRIVSKVLDVDEALTRSIDLPGCWLDIGVGNGSIVTTAAEFGYETYGLEAREETCKQLAAQSVPNVYRGVLDSSFSFASSPLAGRSSRFFNVVSMLDVLEHTVDPVAVLRRVSELLYLNGLLVVSMPNMDSDAWRRMGTVTDLGADPNPYWHEIEHLHNFTRQSLYNLLYRTGFQPIRYSPSERYLAGMEVVARKFASTDLGFRPE